LLVKPYSEISQPPSPHLWQTHPETSLVHLSSSFVGVQIVRVLVLKLWLIIAMRKIFQRPRPSRTPCQQTRRRRAQATSYPDNFLYAQAVPFPASFISAAQPTPYRYDAPEYILDAFFAFMQVHLKRMDRVRLGRALGFGARAAAKTLVQAADAAMSPNPGAAAKAGAASEPNRTRQPAAAPPAPTPRAGNLATATRRAGRSVLEPAKRHSHELWLQMTGGLFALLAFSMGVGMWALRFTVRSAFQNAHSNSAVLWSVDLLKFYVAAVACLMFAYFCVSNFIRASRSSSAARR
jgi:hypothetical protein